MNKLNKQTIKLSHSRPTALTRGDEQTEQTIKLSHSRPASLTWGDEQTNY